MTRQNLVPYTFSGPDGPHVPVANCISVPSRAIMRDAAHYSSPKTFEPLRFATNVTAAGKTDTEANATHAEYTDVLQIPAVGPRQTCLVSPFPIVWQKDSCLHLHVPPKALQSIPHSTQNRFNLCETSTGHFYASIVLKLVVVEILLN